MFYYISTLFVFLFGLFISAIVGVVFFKLSSRFLFRKRPSYVLGGILTILLNYYVVLMYDSFYFLFGVILAPLLYILLHRYVKTDATQN